MLKGITIRRSDREDLARIAHFRKGCFPHDPSVRSHEPEYYEWKCYQNPVAPGEIWLAEDGDLLVGMKSMTPKMVKAPGGVWRAAETGDTFTHPDYQRRGIFTALFKAAAEDGIDRKVDFIYGSPNDNSLPGYEKKLGYGRIPVRLRGLVKPLYSRQLLEEKLHYPALAAAIRPVVEMTSRAILRIGVGGVSRDETSVSQEVAFPDDIDVFCEQSSRNYDVILYRTRDYLQWRYITNPDAYSILIARNKTGTNLGYLVAKLTSSGVKKTGYIADFLTAEENPRVFVKLLAVTLERFFQEKVNLVHVWAVKGSLYDKVLLRVGFFPYSRIPLICYKNDAGNKVLNETLKWHFAMGDTDNV